MVDAVATQRNGKADIILLSGFLGAGKTTLLRRILAWETDLSDTVVIVNEFGEIGIDGALLEETASGIVEMVSGCICCTLKAELNMQLRSIWDEFQPRRIFIEATGVADTDSVLEALNDGKIREHMVVDKIVTVVDADYWEAREHLGPLFFNQIKDANLILLNKIDLVGEEHIPHMLTEIHETFPDCQVVPTRQCAVDPETLWSVASRKDFSIDPSTFYHGGHRTENHAADTQMHGTHGHEAEAHHHHDHEHGYGEDGRKHIHADQEGYVAFSFLSESCEYVKWQGHDETRLAFVGLKVNGDEVMQNLKNCIIQ